MTAAARYQPGARGTQVGGDWYDLLEVDGKVVLVVGDVMGRGVQAAALMGQLRATVRAYAIEAHGPAGVLERLDKVVLSLTGLHFTTCVVGVLDPAAQTLCLASAGHLPPVVVGPDGGARLIELDPGLPLGVGGATFSEQSLDLEPGSLVLLYTDGLVETRTASVDDGLQRLVAALAGPVGSADSACEVVLRAMQREDEQDDDTAILAVMLDSAQSPGRLRVFLPAAPQSPRSARTALRSLVEGAGFEYDDAVLLVSELVTNAVRYAGDDDVLLCASLDDGLLRVEVRDSGRTLPPLPDLPEWEAEGGRGLALVAELADRWGSDVVSGGKRLWFELRPGPLT